MGSRTVMLTRLSPVTVFRTTLALALVGLVAWLVAVTLLYYGLGVVGVWDSVNSLIGGIGGQQIISFGLVIGLAALMGLAVALVLTILAPMGALIYNSFVDLIGGIEVDIADTSAASSPASSSVPSTQ